MPIATPAASGLAKHSSSSVLTVHLRVALAAAPKPGAEKAAPVTRDGPARAPNRSLVFCVGFVSLVVFIEPALQLAIGPTMHLRGLYLHSLVAFIEPPLQLAIGPTMHLRGLHLGGLGLLLLLRLCERCIGHAESHDPGDRKCHSGEYWCHNAHKHFLRFLLTASNLMQRLPESKGYDVGDGTILV
jgi:hypothetical protein